MNKQSQCHTMRCTSVMQAGVQLKATEVEIMPSYGPSWLGKE